MSLESLLDDDALNPEKLFNEKEYNTLLVSREGFSKKQNATADFILTLIEKDLSRQEQEEIFSNLKQAKAQSILIDAIKESNNDKHRAKLVAACWESGLDMSSHFLFFTKLACYEDFSVAMEALTVISNIEEKIDENVLTAAIEIAQNCKSPNVPLVDDLIASIKLRTA